MRGSTQEKYLEAKLQDITRTEGRDLTTPDLYVEVNYLIPGTEEISEKVSGRHTRLIWYLTHLSLSCSVSCQVVERLHFAAVSDCLELHELILILMHCTNLHSDDQSDGGAGGRHHWSRRSNWENSQHCGARGKEGKS